jgi:hypothetical protein
MSRIFYRRVWIGEKMMEHGWLTDIIRYMILTYFDLDE